MRENIIFVCPFCEKFSKLSGVPGEIDGLPVDWPAVERIIREISENNPDFRAEATRCLHCDKFLDFLEVVIHLTGESTRVSVHHRIIPFRSLLKGNQPIQDCVLTCPNPGFDPSQIEFVLRALRPEGP